ncbi:MAG: acyl carrier protein [Legionellales bacterium]|nr:acyl carrier protein [Legionellales bacterium]
MNEQEVFLKVVSLIKPYAKNEVGFNSISKESKILQDLGVNSARLVDIVLAFEDMFNIEIDDDAADNIWTIGDAITLIQAKLQNAQ